VIGLRCHIGRNVTIRDSILMGADFYPIAGAAAEEEELKQPRLGVGEGSTISGAIVDKNCQIGKDVHIECAAENATDADFDNVSIRDGITVVHKGAVLGDGWKFAQCKATSSSVP
jgi:glucose-1-phosphate adenylyltransferase